MSEKSVDLNSTPANSTRMKTRQGRKMADPLTSKGKETFKLPKPPQQNTNTKSKQLRIRTVAERKQTYCHTGELLKLYQAITATLIN